MIEVDCRTISDNGNNPHQNPALNFCALPQGPFLERYYERKRHWRLAEAEFVAATAVVVLV